MLQSMRQFKAGIFQALSHPTRVAIVESLERGELTVGQICDKLEIEQSNASQHLAKLRNKHIVEFRKEANQVFYRLRDPRLGEVLAKMREYFHAHLDDALELLRTEKKSTPKKRSLR